jgi:hypothetical protein
VHPGGTCALLGKAPVLKGFTGYSKRHQAATQSFYRLSQDNLDSQRGHGCRSGIQTIYDGLTLLSFDHLCIVPSQSTRLFFAMSLNRLAYCALLGRPAYRTGIRMTSTIVGRSGRVYEQGEVLHRHRENHKLSISKLSTFQAPYPSFLLRSEDKSFVVKCVPRPFYDLSLRLAAEFTGSRRLRMHIDYNQEESILVYPYFRCTLLALMKEDPDIPVAEREKILRHVAEALQEFHGKNWIHIGTISMS